MQHEAAYTVEKTSWLARIGSFEAEKTREKTDEVNLLTRLGATRMTDRTRTDMEKDFDEAWMRTSTFRMRFTGLITIRASNPKILEKIQKLNTVNFCSRRTPGGMRDSTVSSLMLSSVLGIPVQLARASST